MKLNRYLVLVVLRTLKKVFSRCNFSDNSVQALSSSNSNVQLFYLLLFFVILIALSPRYRFCTVVNLNDLIKRGARGTLGSFSSRCVILRSGLPKRLAIEPTVTPKYRDIVSGKGKYRDPVRENRQYRDTEKSSLQIYITSSTLVQHGPVRDITTYV